MFQTINTGNCQITTESTSNSLSHAAVIAVASSVTVFILSSVLFIITGCVCGSLLQKHKQVTREISGKIVEPQHSQPTLVYEEILPKPIEHQRQEQHVHKQVTREISGKIVDPQLSQPTRVYEEILPKSIEHQRQEQGVKVNENVAYIPV